MPTSRATWSGSISFGMMAIPIKLYRATSSQDFSFNQLHREDGKPVNYLKVCKQHDEPVELGAADIMRGYQVSKGNYVTVEDEDLENLPLPSKHVISLEQFTPASQVDPIYFDTAYYVEPEVAGQKPYALLVKALRSKGTVGIAKIALRQRESLAMIRPVGNVLVLETMYYGSEVRDFDITEVVTSDAEQRMADMLVEAMTEPFDSAAYTDGYHEAVKAMIDAKLGGGEAPAPAPEPAAPAASDLMAALQASLAAIKRPQADADEPETKEATFAF